MAKLAMAQIRNTRQARGWGAAVLALLDGRQRVLLRKGGIREAGPGRDFAVEHRAFVLLPTYFHAQDLGRERDLIPEVHAALAQLRPPASGLLRFELHAEVTGLWWVPELARLKLTGTVSLSSGRQDDALARCQRADRILTATTGLAPTHTPAWQT